ADGKEAGRLPLTPQTQQAIMSGDGKWIAESRYDQQSQAQHLEYRPSNGQPTAVPIDKGFDVLAPVFSTDSRYLLYTTYTYQPTPQYILGVVELVSGKKVEFTGNVNLNNSDSKGAFP